MLNWQIFPHCHRLPHFFFKQLISANQDLMDSMISCKSCLFPSAKIVDLRS